MHYILKLFLIINLQDKIKRLIFFTFLLNVAPFLQAQVYQWAKNMGGGSSMNEAGKLAIDSKGNVYTMGTFQDTMNFNPSGAGYSLISSGLSDIFICKFDANGSFIWAKKLGGKDHEFAISITIDVNNSIYLLGSFRDTVDFDLGTGTYNLNTKPGNFETFICKMNSNGNFVWAEKIGGTNFGPGYSLALDFWANVCIIGNFWGTIDFDDGPAIHNLTSDGGSVDVFICKLDSNGNFIWVKGMGGDNYDYGYSIAIDFLGNIYTTGTFMDSADFNPGPIIYNLKSSGSSDIFISKLDSAGNFKWAKKIGGFNNDWGQSIAVDATGSVYTTGQVYATVDFDPGPGTYNLTPAGGRGVFISKLGTDGSFSWAKTVGGNDINVHGIAIYGNSNLYITGESNGTGDFDPGSGIYDLITAAWDIYILKLNTAGNFVWAKNIGGPNDEGSRDIKVDANESVFITGFFTGTVDFAPPTATNMTSIGNNDIYVAKYNNAITNVQQNSSKNDLIFYPNPTMGNLIIDLGQQLPTTEVIITNVLGQELNRKKYYNTSSFNINIEGERGIYFLIVKSESKTTNFKVTKQ